MRLRMTAPLALLAAASVACSAAPSESDHRQALIETLQAAREAANAGDIDGLLSHWTDDVVIYPVSEPAVRGKDAVREYVRAGRARGVRPLVTPIEIVTAKSGDIGYIVGTHEWVNREGETSMPGRYVTLWRRTDAGEWKMFLEIHSPRPD